MSLDGSVWVGTDAAIFGQGTVEIWVAPRKITICGKATVDNVDAHRKHIAPRKGREMVFQALDLPVEIDPSHVTAKFNGPSLEIVLRKALAKGQQQAAAA